MSAPRRAVKRLSDVHREIHSSTMMLARFARRYGDEHAKLLALAKTSRFYFSRLRAIGE